MNKRTTRRKSVLIQELLDKITPQEQEKTNERMALAARLDDLIKAKGWSKSEFAAKLEKNPSEITKWLSGTHNFTIDTLTEIAMVFDLKLTELFESKKEPAIFLSVEIKSDPVKRPISYSTPIGDKAGYGSYHQDGFFVSVIGEASRNYVN